MSLSGERTRIEPFFLPAENGTRFCLLHRPPPGVEVRGSVLYVHPFAEEMNKTRRMAGMQSRALAGVGYAVLQIDLFGCGDSSGEIRDATVPVWQSDIELALQWLREQNLGSLTLWGLRFGALLAADWANRTDLQIDRLLLWQPLISGETHLTQFLRISVAADMLTATGSSGGSAALRKRLAAGEALEVAGYDVTPGLAEQMDGLRLPKAAGAGIALHWFEVVAEPGGTLPPGSTRAVERWRSTGAAVHERVVIGDPFWATVEITDCPSLLEATTQVMASR